MKEGLTIPYLIDNGEVSLFISPNKRERERPARRERDSISSSTFPIITTDEMRRKKRTHFSHIYFSYL